MPPRATNGGEVRDTLHRRTTEVARTLRRNATPTEGMLWEALRGARRGYKVRRQQPIGGFCVDFLIPCARLVVEVDGTMHDTQQEADAARQAVLEAEGLHVVRFRSEEVLVDLPGVLRRMDATVAMCRQALHRPKGRVADRRAPPS